MNLSRRQILQHAGLGFGALALTGLARRDANASAANPLAPRPPHFAPKAKSVIYLFMHGGPSQVDTFDPKPTLARYDGQPPPKEFHRLQFQFTDVSRQRWLGSQQT